MTAPRQRTLWDPEIPPYALDYKRHPHYWMPSERWLTAPWTHERPDLICDVCGAERLPPLSWRLIVAFACFVGGVVASIIIGPFYFWILGWITSCLFTEMHERHEKRWMERHILEVASR